MGRPTLNKVAERAGVSVATVSRSLHDDPAVVAETRARVLAACSELGYVPSLAGRRLRQGSKAVVGLSLGINDHSVSRYVSLMHQALGRQLAASGWSVRLIRADEFHTGPDVGGLIVIGVLKDDPRLETMRASDIPTIAIGHGTDGFFLAPDDAAGGRLAAEHLLRRGCASLGVLYSPDAQGTIAERVRAFSKTAASGGVAPLDLVAEASATPTLQGYRAVMRALTSGKRFEGLFCETDEMAVGALAAIEDAGLDVPGDVAVIGFDDLPEFADNLTTIRQDISRIAQAAIDLLAEARRGGPPRAVLLPVELKIRQTA